LRVDEIEWRVDDDGHVEGLETRKRERRNMSEKEETIAGDTFQLTENP
jgi:hypothetical protein